MSAQKDELKLRMKSTRLIKALIKKYEIYIYIKWNRDLN